MPETVPLCHLQIKMCERDAPRKHSPFGVTGTTSKVRIRRSSIFKKIFGCNIFTPNTTVFRRVHRNPGTFSRGLTKITELCYDEGALPMDSGIEVGLTEDMELKTATNFYLNLGFYSSIIHPLFFNTTKTMRKSNISPYTQTI